MGKLLEIGKSVVKVAKDDYRRVLHSVKVGFAVTLISLFYYSQQLYHGFGSSALWAVFTVIVVFEFYVGATLYKGLNRTVATLVAAALAVGVHSLASKCGDIGQPLLIGLLVFLQAAVATFMRFFPKIKARYDYGFNIFILTFAFVAISSFRAKEIIELARSRGATIVIGVVGSLLISILVLPAWAGEDLHNLVASNIDKLGNTLDAFGPAYFSKEENNVTKCEISRLQAYTTVLDTKNTEEILANFARWEPCHGQFRIKHPWVQYLKLGALTRDCAYKIDALSSHFHVDIKAPTKFKCPIREECNKMSSEASKALKELAISLKDMTQPSSCDAHIVQSKAAVKRLKVLLKCSTLWEDCELLQIIPATTIASLVFDIVECTEKIVECAYEISSLAHFEATKVVKQESISENDVKTNQDQSRTSTSHNVIDRPQIVITIDGGD